MLIETSHPVHWEQSVEWGDQDAFGHVNNVVYFRYCENARLAHFERVGMPFPNNGPLGPIVATASCDFLRPVSYPDRLRVETGVSRLGSSSFTYSYRIFSQQQNDWVCRGSAVAVLFDYQQKRATPLPEALRERILALET